MFEKDAYTGGKCMGTLVEGKVHELTHRQVFAKNTHLISFLKEIPTGSGSCFDSLYPQSKVQFQWGRNQKTMQFKRGYFNLVEKLLDDAKSAYAMLYAKVPAWDVLWFKGQLEKENDLDILRHISVGEYFEYKKRPKLAAFIKPVLLSWIGATDKTSACAVLDLLNNKKGPFHPEAPLAYSLGIREPIGDAFIFPITKHLLENGVEIHLSCEVSGLHSEHDKSNIEYLTLVNGEKVFADAFILATPAHVTSSLINEDVKKLDFEYILSHGFQFHFSETPSSLKDKSVGIVLDSPWGLSYHVTTRQTPKGSRVCLSVTATELRKTIGALYNRPLMDCDEQEVMNEILIQIFDSTALLNDPAFLGFTVGLGGNFTTEKNVRSLYKDWFKGNAVIDEQGEKHYWVFQHALTHPSAKNKQTIEVEPYNNLFLIGEYLSDPKQKWHVPVTLERCIETVHLCVEKIQNTKVLVAEV